MIERFDNVGIAVRDFERAVDFYQRLGFTISARYDETPSAIFTAGEARLYIFGTASQDPPHRRDLSLFGNPPGVDHLSFWVGDVDAAYNSISERGVHFEAPPADME